MPRRVIFVTSLRGLVALSVVLVCASGTLAAGEKHELISRRDAYSFVLCYYGDALDSAATNTGSKDRGPREFAPDLAVRGVDPAAVTQAGVRTSDWKLIHYPGRAYGELYDLRNDPGEFFNLCADAGYANRRQALERLLMDRLAAAQDPLPERHYDW